MAATKAFAKFDDIDSFWNNAVVSASPSDQSGFVDEFAYDTSSTISDVSEEESVRDEVPSPATNEKTSSTGLSESLSLHDNIESMDNDEDTDVQEFSSDEGRGVGSGKRRPRLKSTGGKADRRSSAPAVLNIRRQKEQNKSASPFHAGRLSGIGTGGSRQMKPTDSSVEEPELVGQDDDFDNQDFVDDLDWHSTPGSSVRGSHNLTTTSPEAPGSPSTSTPALTKASAPRVKTDSKRRVSYAPDVSTISTPGSAEFPRGRAIPDESYHEDDTDNGLDTTEDWDSSRYSQATGGYVDTSFMSNARKGIYSSDEEEEAGGGSEEESHEEGVRRSKRVTKGQTMQWWKNERTVYAKGRMVGLMRAGPTPKKARRGRAHRRGDSGKDLSHKLKRARTTQEGNISDDSELDTRAMPLPRIPAYEYLDRDSVSTLRIWDDDLEKPSELQTFRPSEALQPPAQLPISAPRPPGKDVVALAAQSFNIQSTTRMSGWISGFMELLPGAIKDAEGVGQCSQVFVVSSCQDGAVEFGLADPENEQWMDDSAQRILLKRGDFFFVPPGNVYRLENHSTVKSCMIYWTIIQPLPDEDDAGTE